MNKIVLANGIAQVVLGLVFIMYAVVIGDLLQFSIWLVLLIVVGGIMNIFLGCMLIRDYVESRK